jgi:ABC-type glycerol-3-phosphate transport system permease component
MTESASRRARAADIQRFFATYGLHLLLTAMGFVFCIPFLWMVLTSLKPLKDADAPNWLPEDGRLRWENYRDVSDQAAAVDVAGTVRSKGVEGKTTTIVVQRSDGTEAAVAVDRKTRFVDSATGLGMEVAAVQPGQAVRAVRPAGDGVPFGRFYWNSIFVASWVTFLQVLTSSLAAFSFSRLKWRGREKVFMLYLATMMLPGLVMMIPNYQIMIKLGLVDSYAGLIIPASFSAFGTFLLRQFMLTIPTSLDEAAEIDGASKWQVYWNVIMPLARPGLITLTIFTFMGSYNSFFWPLVMLKSTAKYTLPVGMLFFDSTRGQVTHLLMAAITMSVAPMVVVYVLMQKQMVKGIQLGAVKG